MKGLGTLIRLHSQQLDDKRRVLADLQALGERLRQSLVDLGEEMRREQGVAAMSVETGMTYAGYAKALIERRETIEQSIRECDQQIAAATEEVREAFGELKKFEIARANRERRAQEAAGRVEQAGFDEMGLSIHRRRDQGGESA
jgi:flagellar export protein FliJ